MSSTRWKAPVLIGAVILAIVGGLASGAAIAVVPTLLSPVGLTPDTGARSDALPDPTYPVNEGGQTYGSAMDSNSPGNEPNLILVVADSGREGYVAKAALDAVNGSAENFKTPEEAIAWQEVNAGVNHTVPVYQSDGKTVIGEFTVYGTSKQLRQ